MRRRVLCLDNLDTQNERYRRRKSTLYKKEIRGLHEQEQQQEVVVEVVGGHFILFCFVISTTRFL